MRTFLLLAGIIGLLPAVTVPDTKTPLQVGTVYFESLTKGDLGMLEGLLSAPFSCDGERLDTLEAVKAMHQKVVGHKGKRELPAYEVGLAEDAPPLPADPYGETTAVVITIKEGDHDGDKIYIYLKVVDKQPLVVGFKD